MSKIKCEYPSPSNSLAAKAQTTYNSSGLIFLFFKYCHESLHFWNRSREFIVVKGVKKEKEKEERERMGRNEVDREQETGRRRDGTGSC